MSGDRSRSPADGDAGRDLWRRASEVFAEAIERPEDERTAFVAERCGADAALRAEVMDLLAAHEAEGILDGTFGPPAAEPDLRARVAEALADHYRIIHRLGEGGTADVFLAWEKKHDRRVVLKVMRPEAQVLFGHERFLEEVRLASGLSHPHILPFIDSGRADGLLYYVMPYVEGETLFERIARDAPLPAASALPLLRDVAEALAYAHAAGVVHRDLKPGNVLCAGAHAYLMDFGVAKALRGAPEEAPRTRAGFAPGTPRYMAPEQMDARPDVGPPADVFAWGQLAHECLTGAVLPPPWSTTEEVEAAILKTRADVPPRLAALVSRALSVHEGLRPSAAEVVSELEALSAPGETGDRPIASGRPRSRRRSLRWTGMAAAGIALAAFGLTLSSGRNAGGPPPGASGPVAVAEFRNETGDPALDFLGRLTGDWITQGLQEVGTASVIPWPTALAASNDARSASGLDPAPILRRETGARMVVTGAFYRVGERVRFQAEIVDAVGQRVLVAPEAVLAPLDRPEDAVTELRERIMGSVAVLTGGRASGLPGLANRAPTFEAYRLFDRALGLYLAQEYSEATPLFLDAYERDTTFTTSLLYGAVTAWNQGDRHVTDSLVALLGTQRDRLSEYDDLRWRFLSAMLESDGQEALRVLRRSMEIGPASQAAYNLGRQAVMMNRPGEAARVLGSLDPDVGAMRGWAQYWTQLTHALHLLLRHDEEAEAAAEMVRRHPERRVAPVLEARALAAGGRLVALDSVLALSALRPARTYWSHGAALVVAGEEILAHGSPKDARPYLEQALAWLDVQISADPDYLAHRYWRGSALYDLERWEEASGTFEALLRVDPGSTAYLGPAAVAAARLGDEERAERHLEPERWGYDMGDRLMYAARVSAVFGDLDRALAQVADALSRGSTGYAWMHASGHHDWALLRSDARIASLLRPTE